MARSKRGKLRTKKRSRILKETKGYRHGRKKKIREAKEAIAHAGSHAYAHRKDKKNGKRREWQIVINAAVRPLGLSYSKFINALKKNEIGLDRKSLATLAKEKPETFERIVEKVK